MMIINFITTSPFVQDETLEWYLVPLSLRHSTCEDIFQNIHVTCPRGAPAPPCVSSADNGTTVPGPHCEFPCSSSSAPVPCAAPTGHRDLLKTSVRPFWTFPHIWNTLQGPRKGRWGSWPRQFCPLGPDHLSSSQTLRPLGWPGGFALGIPFLARSPLGHHQTRSCPDALGSA